MRPPHPFLDQHIKHNDTKYYFILSWTNISNIMTQELLLKGSGLKGEAREGEWVRVRGEGQGMVRIRVKL
jgi:hypothetical protein